MDLIQRPLSEVQITLDDFSETEQTEIQSKLENLCTFSHRSQSEYMFWVPPFDIHQDYIAKEYPELPDQIKTPLTELVRQQADQEDQGYLLVVLL